MEQFILKRTVDILRSCNACCGTSICSLYRPKPLLSLASYLDLWSGRVVEGNIVKFNFSLDFIQFKALFRHAVNFWLLQQSRHFSWWDFVTSWYQCANFCVSNCFFFLTELYWNVTKNILETALFTAVALQYSEMQCLDSASACFYVHKVIENVPP